MYLFLRPDDRIALRDGPDWIGNDRVIISTDLVLDYESWKQKRNRCFGQLFDYGRTRDKSESSTFTRNAVSLYDVYFNQSTVVSGTSRHHDF